MFEIISKYYGIDLLAMTITFIGIYILGNKNRYGFLIAISANIIWIIFGVLAETLGVIFANIALSILYLRGYIKWGK